MASILIKNAAVITLDKQARVLEGHDILIEGDRIKSIKPGLSAPRSVSCEVIDAGGRVVMPGMINAHTHFYSSFACGFGNVPLSHNFVDVLNNLWWRLDKALNEEDVYYSALIACIYAIKAGTTTIIDHHASPGSIRGSLSRIKDAVSDAGLRASLCYELTDRHGDYGIKAGIEENLNFLAGLHGCHDDRFHGLFGLHASFSLSAKTLGLVAAAVKGSDVGYHIHVGEDASDQQDAVSKYHKRVVPRLYDHGILGPTTICGHCVHIDDDEMTLLQQTNSIVVHNPESNMNNAVGAMDLFKFLYKGILVGLGTDAMTNNMYQELRTGLWLRRHAMQNPTCGFTEMARLLCENNPKIADRFWPSLGLGKLVEGGKADVVIMDYLPATPLLATNYLGHLIFGVAQAAADTTIAGGKVLMRAGRLTGFDESAVAATCRRLAAKLWERIV